MKHTVQISVLGKQYSICSEATPEEVGRVADLVNAKIDEAAEGRRPADTLNIAVLALLNLGGAYLRLCDETKRDVQAADRLKHLLERLDSALPYPPEA